MISCKAVLALALVAALSQQSSSFFLGLPNPISGIQSAVTSGIALGNSASQTGLKLVNDGVQGGVGAGQQVVNTLSGLRSTALKGGVDMVSQGIDIGTNLASTIPVVGSLANVGGGMAKAGLNVGNLLGQTVNSARAGVANGVLGLVSGLTSAGTGLAGNVVNMGANMASTGAQTGFGLANSVLGTVGNVIDTKVNYVNQALGRVSSMASSAADRMSFNAYSAPADQNVLSSSTTTPASAQR